MAWGGKEQNIFAILTWGRGIEKVKKHLSADADYSFTLGTG